MTDENPSWYACHTRSRHEKKVHEYLSRRGLEAYLPLVPEERRWSDRTKTVEFPAFPGYVFVRFRLPRMHEVLSTPGLSTIVRTNGRPARIPDDEMDNVRRTVEAMSTSGAQVTRVPFLEEGQTVRVVAGPFNGITGVVSETRGRNRVLVGLRALKQGFEVDVPREYLRPSSDDV